jgi:hypothetical protein
MTARLDAHAAERAAYRLADLPADVREKAVRLADAYAASHPTDRHAVRVHRGDTFHGHAWSEESNGHDVWAIVDNGVVRTFMYRRRQQAADRRAFNVRYLALED